MTMQLQEYRTPAGNTYWYITADMPDGKRYRPGYVNCVMLYSQNPGYRVDYTDGYKTQLLGYFPDRLEALAAMTQAILHGCGDGNFQSHYRSNFTTNED